MAADENDPHRTTGKRSRNRPSREPPVIEGEATKVDSETPPPPGTTDEPAPEIRAEEGDARETEGEPVASGPEMPEADLSSRPEPPPPPPPPPPPSRPSRLPVFLALLLGVSGVALGAYAWQQAQDATSSVTDLRNQLAALQARPAPQPAAAPAAVRPEQLAALDQRIKAIEQRPAPANGPSPAAGTSAGSSDAVSALSRRVDALDQRLQEIAARPAAAPAPSGPLPASTDDLKALAGRVAAMETAARAASEAAKSAVQTASQAADAAAARPTTPPVDLGPLEGRIGALDQRLASVENDMRATKTEVRAREEPIEAVSKQGAAAGLAVVAQQISQAVERGTPFASDLKTAEALGADPGRLAPLRAVADKGAPTARALAQTWASVSRQALEAAQGPIADQGILDRMKASAAKLVRVRPVGEPVGDDPSALAARIEGALGRGAVADALAAWDKLPEPAKAASRSFGDAARQRVAADNAAKALASGAVADLARPKGAP